MAINIFQGGKQPKQTVNSASASSRAQAAKDALVSAAETSNSGSTAVSTKGTLSKVGNTLGKVTGLAAKFLPGVGGAVAKGLSNLLNDPEWWQSVPGDAVTLNQGLQPIENQSYTLMRQAIVEFRDTTGQTNPRVMVPTDQQLTQYLMPQIRRVVNAVPLQEASVYGDVLAANATLYAMWRYLKKLHYMTTHGQTYIPSMNDPAFPLFQTTNSAYLTAAINRLEEYLRANVRLPHTMCEYLAWRYGRVYKSSDSLKASIILYAPVIGLSSTPTAVDQVVEELMRVVASDKEHQTANSDLYNAYYDHDLLVEIADHTQFTYDPKEFALRTNLDILTATEAAYNDEPNFVYLDSKLDNPTAFMASTISTRYRTGNNTNDFTTLIPCSGFVAYMYCPKTYPKVATNQRTVALTVGGYNPSQVPPSEDGFAGWKRDQDTYWLQFSVSNPGWDIAFSLEGGWDGPSEYARVLNTITALQVLKANEIYNKDVRVPLAVYGNDGSAMTTYVDLSAPNYDLAIVQDYTIRQEQVYAFANMVDVTRKHSLSYKAAEKLVTKEAANLIETLDVAAVQSPASPSATGAKVPAK